MCVDDEPVVSGCVDRDFRLFMMAASSLCKEAEALSSPYSVYSEFYRVWSAIDSVWGRQVGSWRTGEWAALSVLRSLQRL